MHFNHFLFYLEGWDRRYKNMLKEKLGPIQPNKRQNNWLDIWLGIFKTDENLTKTEKRKSCKDWCMWWRARGYDFTKRIGSTIRTAFGTNFSLYVHLIPNIVIDFNNFGINYNFLIIFFIFNNFFDHPFLDQSFFFVSLATFIFQWFYICLL